MFEEWIIGAAEDCKERGKREDGDTTMVQNSLKLGHLITLLPRSIGVNE